MRAPLLVTLIVTLAAAIDVVSVGPYLHRTEWWFGAGALAAAVAIGSYQLRVQRLQSNEKQLNKLVADKTAELQERTEQLRIANDLLEELATVDSLTDLANRRRFDAFLSQAWPRARRARTPMSLLLMDVDYFKLYNDTYGHPKGDECLAQIARVLKDGIRRSDDLAARFGGEEFAVVLSDTAKDGAQVVAEVIRQRVEGLGLTHVPPAPAGVVTVSIGVATVIPDAEHAAADLVSACDRALYRAKLNGRNRCEVA